MFSFGTLFPCKTIWPKGIDIIRYAPIIDKLWMWIQSLSIGINIFQEVKGHYFNVKSKLAGITEKKGEKENTLGKAIKE